jgi:predicted nucleic acid-binding protein
MKYLVDTNILSDMTKPQPNKGVMNWFSNTIDTDMFISVISIGEIVCGIEKLPDSTKKVNLSAWFNEIIQDGFTDRIANIDTNIITIWGKLQAKLPRPLQIQDTLIAATALARDMTVVTRNIKDFKDIADIKLLNPWED